jgi:hypothetical protein
VIAGAEVQIGNPATAERYSVQTDSWGNYSVLQLPPALDEIKIQASGFTPAVFRGVAVGLAETTTINATCKWPKAMAKRR